jgi:hypothetical protein
MSRLPCDDFNSPLMSSAHMPLLSGFSVRPHWAHAAGAGFRERSQEAHGGSFLRLCLGRFSVHIHDISARSRDQNHNEGYPPNWTSRSSFPGWESSEISLLYLAGFVLVRCNRQGNWGSDWFERGKAGTQSVQVGEEEMESSGGAAVLTLLGRAVRPAGGSHGDGGAASFF